MLVASIITSVATQTQLAHDQHIVPQWHLTKFTDVDGTLWCYKRDMPVKKSCPKGECWARDFYEYEVNGKRTENRYERWLAGIEDAAAPVHEALINRQPLSHRETLVWALYVASLFLRTKKVRSQISSAMVQKFREFADSPDFVRDLQLDLFQRGDLVFTDDLKKLVERLRTDMDSSPSYHHLTSLQANTNSLAKALAGKVWHVLETAPEEFFVISDCPVTTFEFASGHYYPGPGFGKESTTVVLPMTPKCVFLASSPRGRWKPVGPPEAVHATNLLTVRFGFERVCAHVNSADVKALVDAEINRITFGRDAFVPASLPQYHPQPSGQ